ncbi:MAG: OmpA family protein [Bacteroidota bacterium]
MKQETRHRSTKELTPGTITQANPRAPVVRPPKNNPPGPPTTKPPTDFPVAKVTTTPSSAPPTKPEIPPDQPSESGPPHRKNPFKEMTQEEKRKTLLEMKPELILPPIRFITAQDEFSVVNMDSFMQAMEYAQQGKIVLIEGHTDDVGSDDSNLKLSMKRAEKIRQLMISGGVNDDLLSEIGFGETQPLVPNTSAENRAVNRRIEFKIFSAPE